VQGLVWGWVMGEGWGLAWSVPAAAATGRRHGRVGAVCMMQRTNG
jgi:hypothetical protein